MHPPGNHHHPQGQPRGDGGDGDGREEPKVWQGEGGIYRGQQNHEW
jgi:hypothetical protein